MDVQLIMGSASDAEIAKKACAILKKFGVDYEVSVISAHRALDLLEDKVKNSQAKVFIGFAGKAAHLSGVMAGMTTKPVIGVPIYSKTLEGMDALLATVQMPKGVPVATVAIDGAENAAILAVQILALQDETLAQKLVDYKAEMVENVKTMDEELGEL